MSDKLTGFNLANLSIMLDKLGEDRVKDILSSFHCPKNPDVESFIKDKAILFALQGLSSTHIVTTSFRQEPVIVGYFTLAQKTIEVDMARFKSKTQQKKISKFATFDPLKRCHVLSAALIAQLGKNFHNNYNNLITGGELLQMAIDKIKAVQLDIGGRIIYLECEDVEHLNNFYDSHGFIDFNDRELDAEERKLMHGTCLKQKLRVISHK